MINEEEIRLVYRALLNRNPENDRVIEAHKKTLDLETFIRRVIASDEYIRKSGNKSAKSELKPLHWPKQKIDVTSAADDLRSMVKHVNETWTNLGEQEPHWSVITSDNYKKNKIGQNEAQFFESGEINVQTFEAFLARSDLSLRGHEVCFELGCGVGRLTVALAKRFTEVVAADISRSHLELAKEALREREVGNVKLMHLTTVADLDALDPFDVFFSLIVLQHNPPPVMAAMLRTILSKLNKGGIGYFQIPTYGKGYSFSTQTYLDGGKVEGMMEMHVLPQKEVFELLAEADCRLLEIREDGWTGNPLGISNTFLIQKSG